MKGIIFEIEKIELLTHMIESFTAIFVLIRRVSYAFESMTLCFADARRATA